MTNSLTRRELLRATAFLGAGAVSRAPFLYADESSAVQKPLDVGSRLELAIDPRWIASMDGLRLQQHRPVPREIVLSSPKGVVDKPNLKLFSIPGSNDGNAITEGNKAEPGDDDPDHGPRISHNMRPFIDTRPGVPESERYKALAGGFNSSRRPAGFWALASGHGIHWRKMRKQWVIDRSNWPHGSDSTPACAHWSEAEEQYVAYIRIRVNPNNPTEGRNGGGLRWIGRVTSKDFLNWSKVTPMKPLVTDLVCGRVSRLARSFRRTVRSRPHGTGMEPGYDPLAPYRSRQRSDSERNKERGLRLGHGLRQSTDRHTGRDSTLLRWM